MHFLALAICILTWLLLWGTFWRLLDDWRSGFLAAAATWGTALVAITEILSLIHALEFRWVAAAWSACLVAAAGLWLRFVGDPRRLMKDGWSGRLTKVEWGLVAASVVIAGLLAVIAWIAPPNTDDAMAYHMPRVMHWIQDRSVAFFPAHILRQLYLSPGSEFIVLHFVILSGSDKLANFVQWASMIGSAIAVSLAARELGAGKHGQLLSAVFGMTLPMGILQATGTQSDYVTGFWLAAFAYWMLRLRSRGDAWSAVAMGASLGLALLSKATAYIFALPLLAWMSWQVMRSFGKRGTALLAAAAILTVMVNLPTYVRETRLFGNPLGFTEEPTIGVYSNEVVTPAAFASNVIRNAALHMDTPFPALDSALTRGIVKLHEAMGISAQDPRTTWAGIGFSIEPTAFYENMDGNPLHFALIGVCAVLIAARGDLRKRLLAAMLCVAAAALLFCLVLKWQPWGSRLHLPLFLLAAPIIGAAIESTRRKWAPRALAGLLLIAALPWVLLNQSRPLVGPESILTAERLKRDSATMANYVGAVTFAAKHMGDQCTEVGLYLRPDDLEYAFWVLLPRYFRGNVTIESVGVDNVSKAEYANFPEKPACVVFATREVPADGLQLAGGKYVSAREFGIIRVLLPAE